MDKSVYTDGLSAQAGDLTNTEDTKIAALVNRTEEFGTTRYGVVIGFGLSGTAFVITVGAGVGYDPNGERVETLSTTTFVVTSADVGRFVRAKYTFTDTGDVAHPVTGVELSTRKVTSSQMYIANAGDISGLKLGQITAISQDGTVVFDLTPAGRDEWTALVHAGKLDGTYQDAGSSFVAHAIDVGTGVVSPQNPHGISLVDIGWLPDQTPRKHQQRDHHNGVEPAPGFETSVAGAVSVVPGPPDSATITQIAGLNTIVVDGVRLVAGGVSPTTVTFVDADISKHPGMYELVLDPNDTPVGVPVKNLRLVYVGQRTAVGVQPVDCDQDHEDGPFYLTYTANPKTLRWADGPTVTVGTIDALYELRSLSGHVLTVWVDVSALPTFGTRDIIQVQGTEIGKTKFALANLFWSGSDSTKTSPPTTASRLGYGNEGTFGTALDKRTFGTTSFVNLGTKLQEYLSKFHSELHADGWVEGGGGSIKDGFIFQVDGGTVWVGGKRFIIKPATLTLPPSAVSIVYVDDGGVLRHSTQDPAKVHFYKKARFARAYRVQASEDSLKVFHDERVLFQLDKEQMRLGTNSLFSSLVQQIPRMTIDQGPNGNFNPSDGRRNRTRWIFSQGPNGYQNTSVYFTNRSENYTDLVTGTTVIRTSVGFEIAINCEWTPDFGGTPGNDRWVANLTTENALVYGWDTDGFYVRVRTVGDIGISASWFDGAAPPTWSNLALTHNFKLQKMTLRATNSGTGLANNPNSSTGFKNALIPMSIVKAWAVIEFSKEALPPRLIAGHNVLSDIQFVVPFVPGINTPEFYVKLSTATAAAWVDIVDSHYGTIPRGSCIVSNTRGSQDEPYGFYPRAHGRLINVAGDPVIHVKYESILSFTSRPSDPRDIVYVALVGPQIGGDGV